ncbi:Lcl C-terminal domain-containing protein [Desulfopila inferna]|uniref:Lcl C-terminal domain-containing protein n=1 Tax=Desulfopila inferna TaxID=468528 RepID=UPI001964F286|nr:DUF1566 domain-containing protein [Desulfopila inferna]MBM9605734.1 DUF1566 domain-containing protein [Desulfopila inferna]
MKIYTLLLMIVLSVTAVTNLFAAPADVPMTGQATSFSSDSDFEDGDLQRGFPLPSPRFVANGNGTVTDNLTGLIWLRDAGCAGLNNWQETLSWVDSLDSGVCGLTDDYSPGEWRLPNILELWSLMDFGTDTTALPATPHFINVPSSGGNYDYWSSSPYPTYPDEGQVYKANFEHGIIARQGEASSNNGWAVRGENTYYSLDISMPGSGSGTVTGAYTSTSDDVGIYCRDDCRFFFDADSVFDAGSNLSLTATADDDSRFRTWLGDCDSAGNVTLDASKVCTAMFTKKSAILMMVVPAISGNGDR